VLFSSFVEGQLLLISLVLFRQFVIYIDHRLL